MPELPEVEAIARVVKRAEGKTITHVDVLRSAHYFGGIEAGRVNVPPGFRVDDVYRYGKYVVMQSWDYQSSDFLVTHNAMSGFFDWDDEPWTFDYVEGKRKADDSDVRVMITFDDGAILRFHDLRLFGQMYFDVGPAYITNVLKDVGPELMYTELGYNHMGQRPPIGLEGFASVVLADQRPIKELLLDQRLIAGIGNIYANEGCHLAGIDPHIRGVDLSPSQVPVLLAALRCVVDECIPTVRYDWLRIYRRERCGSCGGQVIRTVVGGRATFHCKKCQGA